MADAMGIELPKPPPPPPERGEWRPSAEQLAQWEAERRAAEKQKAERERRERLRKAYDEECKQRGW